MTIRTFLYDADGRDRAISLDAGVVSDLDDRTLLWVDVEGGEPGELEHVASILGLHNEVLAPDVAGRHPDLKNYGTFYRFHVDSAPVAPDAHSRQDAGDAPSVAGAADNGENGGVASQRLDFIVGQTWLLTTHEAAIPFMARFREQDKADTMIGQLSPQALAVSLLDWHLGEYFHQVSAIEAAVDRLDERILRESTTKILLGRIVALRRRVSKLRGLLVSQRDVFYGFSRPDFALVTDSDAAVHHEALTRRFERAIDEIERARDLVTGSFELFTSRTGQQTNNLVKTLSFITAIVGFCAAIAGIFGMNFEISVFKSGYVGFYAVTAGMLVLGFGAALVARARDWL